MMLFRSNLRHLPTPRGVYGLTKIAAISQSSNVLGASSRVPTGTAKEGLAAPLARCSSGPCLIAMSGAQGRLAEAALLLRLMQRRHLNYVLLDWVALG